MICATCTSNSPGCTCSTSSTSGSTCPSDGSGYSYSESVSTSTGLRSIKISGCPNHAFINYNPNTAVKGSLTMEVPLLPGYISASVYAGTSLIKSGGMAHRTRSIFLWIKLVFLCCVNVLFLSRSSRDHDRRSFDI